MKAMNESGYSNPESLTYVSQGVPAVTSVSPGFGPVGWGTQVIIEGSNFVTSGSQQVLFGSIPATSYYAVSTTQIDAVAPSGLAGTVDITVTTAGGTSATSPADQFTFVGAAPLLNAVYPTSGPTAANNTVTITGSFLSTATQVYFGNTASGYVSVNSDNSLTVLVPPAPGSVPVTVYTAYGQATSSYTMSPIRRLRRSPASARQPDLSVAERQS